MSVDELFEILVVLKKEGKGDYRILTEGFTVGTDKDSVEICDKRKEVCL